MRKLLVLGLLIIGLASRLPATTVSGTFVNGVSVGQTGNLYLQLSQSSAQLSTGGCGGPAVVAPTVAVVIPVNSGTVTSTSIIGNDCVAPPQTYYIATFRDLQGNIIFQDDWQIVGSTQNVGNILPSVVPQGTVPVGTMFVTNLIISGTCVIDGTICSSGSIGTLVFSQDLPNQSASFTAGPFTYTTKKTGWHEVDLYSAIVATPSGSNTLTVNWVDENSNTQTCSFDEGTTGVGQPDWNQISCRFWALINTTITYQLQATGSEVASFHALGFQIP